MENPTMPIASDLATLEKRNPFAIEQLKNIILMRQLREAHEIIEKIKEKGEKTTVCGSQDNVT